MQTAIMVAGVQMVLATAGAFGSAEGWLELERHESDLRGSRGVAIAGLLMLFMGILNFKNTVRRVLQWSAVVMPCCSAQLCCSSFPPCERR